MARRELLAEGRLPEAWIAPEHVRVWRSRLHLRKALIDERTQWLLRIRSVSITTASARARLPRSPAPPPASSSPALDLPATR